MALIYGLDPRSMFRVTTREPTILLISALGHNVHDRGRGLERLANIFEYTVM